MSDDKQKPSPEHCPFDQNVVKAQDWLAAAQEADGSWQPQRWGGQPNFTVGLTALASLALIGSDEGALQGPYADNIRRATEFLLAQQKKSGRFGPTFGGVESIVEQCVSLFSLDPAECRAAGLKDNLVRYALGIEDTEDLIADLGQALDRI